MLKVAIYARVGAVAEPEKAISQQLSACRDFCDLKGYTVVSEFLDEGFAGSYVDRPGFSSLLTVAMADEQLFDLIVVADPSRFIDDRASRRTLEYMLGMNGVDLQVLSWDAGYGPGDDDDAPYDRQRSCHGTTWAMAKAG